jgi:hypothetical protein
MHCCALLNAREQVMKCEELSASAAAAKAEAARLDERCRALAAAQGPLSDLTEKLMDSLKSKEKDAVQQV